MMLESNVDVATALKNYYVSLSTNEMFPLGQECQRSVISFAADIEKSVSLLKMQSLRVKLLADIIADRKELVSFRRGLFLCKRRANVARYFNIYKVR